MWGRISISHTLNGRSVRSFNGSWSAIHVIILGILALVLLAVALPVGAQGPTGAVSDDDVNSVAKELFCPICENTPLDVCETQACADWRQVIRDKLAGGQSEEQIKDYFADQYGVRALAEPPAEGVTLLVWLVPLIVVPAAIILFVVYLRNIKRSTETEVVAAVPPAEDSEKPKPDQDPYAARIERELREM